MGLFRTLTGLGFALVACQFPAFEALYENRLQARLDESSRQIAFFEQAAQNCKYSLDRYILFFEAQPQIECQENGHMMRSSIERHQHLKDLYDQLAVARYPRKIFVWVTHFDYELSQDTMKHYQPSLVLDRISGVFALVGALMGWLLITFFFQLIKRLLPARKAKI